MSEACHDRAGQIGALALGRLEPGEEAELRAHAATCSACAGEIDSLVAVGDLLGRADPDRVAEPAVHPAPGEFDRLVGRLDSERRSRRRGGALVGAAMAVAAAAAAIALVVSSGTSPADEVEFDTGDPDVGLAATLTGRPFGTEVEVDVRGVKEGARCRVWLRDETGAREPAGSFVYRYGSGSANTTLVAAMDREAVDEVEIQAGNQSFVAPVGESTE